MSIHNFRDITMSCLVQTILYFILLKYEAYYFGEFNTTKILEIKVKYIIVEHVNYYVSYRYLKNRKTTY